MRGVKKRLRGCRVARPLRFDRQQPVPNRMNRRAPTRIQVLLADDHPIVREGIRAVLAGEPELEVVGEAADGLEVIELARRLAPNVVLMDINMPRMNGLEATVALLKSQPGLRVLVLTMHRNKEYLLEVIRCGAHGYILKDAAPVQLITAIKNVARTGSYFAPEVVPLLAAPSVTTDATTGDRPPEILTPRQIEVLALIASGAGTREIAHRLHVSKRTVDVTRARICSKLGVFTVAGLTQYAIAHGMVKVASRSQEYAAPPPREKATGAPASPDPGA